MPDNADWCCAAGICCGEQRRRAKLAHILHERIPSLPIEHAAMVADVIHDHFTLLPATLGFGPAVEAFAALARSTTYTEP